LSSHGLREDITPAGILAELRSRRIVVRALSSLHRALRRPGLTQHKQA
jgi:hypothetical protein